MSSALSIQDVGLKAGQAAFGRPLITNVHRGLVVEAIVDAALDSKWNWCAADYSSWDFEHVDATRLEVKQSAARQSWAKGNRPSACSFDIAKRTGRWEGASWVDAPGRAADIYVFAHHPVADETADHRDPEQWLFYITLTSKLPDTKRISLVRVKALAEAVRFGKLSEEVERVKSSISQSACY